MYCVKCGVRLKDTEKQCPLCNTWVYHPDIMRENAQSPYPADKYPSAQKRNLWPQAMLSFAFLVPALIVLLCDLQLNSRVDWSGTVIGALLVGYVMLILPFWFKKPNPVIFVPCSFAAAVLYLLYINTVTSGAWFLSFAFPVAGGIGIIVTAVVSLLTYLRRGRLFIFGGAAAALGSFMLLVEFLLNLTFGTERFIGWSLYPLFALVLLGGFLIFLGICRPAREMMQRKFFI